MITKGWYKLVQYELNVCRWRVQEGVSWRQLLVCVRKAYRRILCTVAIYRERIPLMNDGIPETVHKHEYRMDINDVDHRIVIEELNIILLVFFA